MVIKSFQWELWKDCNNTCKFCFLQKKKSNREEKLQSLCDLNKAIDNLGEYNNISLIGGEFFQGQITDVYDEFFDTIKRIFQLYKDKKILSIWITCSLLAKEQTHLYQLLALADEMGIRPQSDNDQTGLWLCTSWDTSGRFLNPVMHNNWHMHMLKIKSLYPWVKLNTTIILQQSFIDLYLNNMFSPKQFSEMYHTSLFYNMCRLPDKDNPRYCDEYKEMSLEEIGDRLLNKKQQYDGFFPKRESFIAFLLNVYSEDRDMADRLYNISFRADKVQRHYNDDIKTVLRDKLHCSDIVNNKCGHSFDYACYSDSTKCCLCDKEEMI